MRALSALLALSLVLGSVPASAQTPEQKYKTGVKLENSGDLVGALASFESIPVEKRDFNARLHIAGCKKKLGRLLEAEQDYEAIRTDPKADKPTVETAASDLEDLRPRIPKLVVKLSAATSNVKVVIDGHETKVPVTVTVNPGTHSVLATRGESQVFKRDVTLAESTTIEVEVDAPAPASAPVVAPTPSSTTTTVTSKDVASSSSQKVWGWVAVGGGVAFGAAAIGSWVYSGKLSDEYLSECRANPDNCDKSKESSARTFETLTWVSGGLAVVAVGVGVTLLVTAPKSSEKTVALRPTFGAVNGFVLSGAF